MSPVVWIDSRGAQALEAGERLDAGWTRETTTGRHIEGSTGDHSNLRFPGTHTLLT
jgi:hypothetical protein